MSRKECVSACVVFGGLMCVCVCVINLCARECIMCPVLTILFFLRQVLSSYITCKEIHETCKEKQMNSPGRCVV